jgi:hypothetical protein
MALGSNKAVFFYTNCHHIWILESHLNCYFFTRVYVRTTRVYHLLCCCSCCCSCWDISQNTAVYTKLVPFHHAFSILQCNLQFAILIFNFQFSIFDFYLISLLRPISTGLWYYCAVTGESKKIVFTSGATEKITSGGNTSDF